MNEYTDPRMGAIGSQEKPFGTQAVAAALGLQQFKAKPVSGLERSTQELKQSISEIQAAVATLQTRLAPVLSPAQEAAVANASNAELGKAPSSPHCNELDGVTTSARSILRSLETLNRTLCC